MKDTLQLKEETKQHKPFNIAASGTLASCSRGNTVVSNRSGS